MGASPPGPARTAGLGRGVMATYPPGPIPALVDDLYTAPALSGLLVQDLAAQVDAWTGQQLPASGGLDRAVAYNQTAVNASIAVAAALANTAVQPHAGVLTQENADLGELGTHTRPWVVVSPTAPNTPGTLVGPHPLWNLLAQTQNATNILINNMAQALSGWIFP